MLGGLYGGRMASTMLLPQQQGQTTGQASRMKATPKENRLKSEQQPRKGEGLCSLI